MTDKRTVFLDSIAAEANAEFAVLEAKLNDETAALEAEAAKKAEDKAVLWKRGETERIRNAAALETAARRTADRRALLARREQYADEVFRAVREKIAAYTRTSAYPAQLASLLAGARSVLGDGESIIWLRREDMELGKALLRKCPGTQLREGNFALGGLCLSVGTKRADLSFDTALDELRGRFPELIGMEIEA